MSEFIETSLFGKPFMSAVIVAAGSSSRMGGTDKQFADLSGMPVLARSLMAFEKCDTVDEIIVVTRTENYDRVKKLCDEYGISKLSSVVIGGNTRAESVRNGVAAVSESCSFVAIHDGARPLVRPFDIDRCAYDAFKYGGAILAVPVTDTVKNVKKNGFIDFTPSRERMFAAQTPQIFEAATYRKLMDEAFKNRSDWTDDSMVFENGFEKVFITTGSRDNIKITTPEDLIIAGEFLRRRKEEENT